MGEATDVSLYRSQAGEVPDRRRLRRARAGRVDLALLSASVKTSPPDLFAEQMDRFLLSCDGASLKGALPIPLMTPLVS
jgi:hypothetical protein